MDFLDCKICQVPYDEEGHRPRNGPCGHEFCTACLKTLIKDSLFVCPTCRQKHKVDAPEDLSLNFGLIDVIRAFKTKTIPLTKETESRVSGATNDGVCNIHCKTIGHRCFTCQIWICDDCLESHTALIGCSTVISTKAMESMKDKHIKNIDMLLINFEDDVNYVSSMIQEHNDKIQDLTDKRNELLKRAEKHGEEVKKLCNLLEQGNILKEKLVESKKHLNTANLPQTVIDSIEVLTQRKQSLRSWSVKNIGPDTLYVFSKAFKEEKNIYVEMVIKDEKRYAKLTQHEERIYFHTFRKQSVANGRICMPFSRLQKMIPEETSLVFLDFNLLFGSGSEGRVLVRLDKNLPNIKENIIQLVTGQRGSSLADIITFDYNSVGFHNQKLEFSDVQVTPDMNGRSKAKRGEVIGFFQNGYLQYIYFCFATPPKTYDYNHFGDGHCVFGNIEHGMDILQGLYNNRTIFLRIQNCGLVIDQK